MSFAYATLVQFAAAGKRRLLLLAIVLATAIVGLLAGAPIASAQVPPPEPTSFSTSVSIAPEPLASAGGGSPVWAFVLVALLGAMVGVAGALAATRVRAGHGELEACVPA
jgi:hypothetical protein